MENDSLKIQLDSIQRILSYCITQTYNVLIGNILRKKSCISNIQLKDILQKEYIRITDELSSIYLNYPALACVEKYYTEDIFLWESTFFESLTKEQKQKYTSFSVSSFEYAKYIEEHTTYNNVLPMFSYLVDAILYERYAKYLTGEIEQMELIEIQTAQHHSSILVNDEPCEQKKKTVIVGKETNPFQSDFTDGQIEILATCINEIQLFTTCISPKILKDLFACKLKGVLKSNNNRQLAYLMQSLNFKGFITDEWQSTIARNELVLGKTKDTPLTRTDLSTATDQINMKQPKGWETIDKYIKQLKKG
uniref:RteC protein n=1 Tax=Prevotella sp. GTC17259 TaxID=3236795 RepID=A0AB33J9Q9_9BACT